MARFVYIFTEGNTDRRTQPSFNLRNLRRFLKDSNVAGVIYKLPIASWNECAWDLPTFKMCADPIPFSPCDPL